MSPFRRGWLLVLSLALLLPSLVFSATWVDVEVTCPVCGAVNIFQVPASYGSYVYRDASRFQYVFWPATTDKFLYTCRRCHLTAYMHDFEGIPGAKIPALERMLEGAARIEGELIPYYDIPMTVRLPIAEKVYELLDRDDAFWCEFRRIEGYHLEQANQVEEATAARLRALSLAERLLASGPDASTRKETLFIAASMRYFTGDLAGAGRALREAEELTFRAPDGDPKASAGLDRYLSELIEDFRDEFLGSQALD